MSKVGEKKNKPIVAFCKRSFVSDSGISPRNISICASPTPVLASSHHKDVWNVVPQVSPSPDQGEDGRFFPYPGILPALGYSCLRPAGPSLPQANSGRQMPVEKVFFEILSGACISLGTVVHEWDGSGALAPLLETQQQRRQHGGKRLVMMNYSPPQPV